VTWARSRRIAPQMGMMRAVQHGHGASHRDGYPGFLVSRPGKAPWFQGLPAWPIGTPECRRGGLNPLAAAGPRAVGHQQAHVAPAWPPEPRRRRPQRLVAPAVAVADAPVVPGTIAGSHPVLLASGGSRQLGQVGAPCSEHPPVPAPLQVGTCAVGGREGKAWCQPEAEPAYPGWHGLDLHPGLS